MQFLDSWTDFFLSVSLSLSHQRPPCSSFTISSCCSSTPSLGSGTSWMRSTVVPGSWSRRSRAVVTPWGASPLVQLTPLWSCLVQSWELMTVRLCVYREQRVHQGGFGPQTSRDAARVLPAGSGAWWVTWNHISSLTHFLMATWATAANYFFFSWPLKIIWRQYKNKKDTWY